MMIIVITHMGDLIFVSIKDIFTAVEDLVTSIVEIDMTVMVLLLYIARCIVKEWSLLIGSWKELLSFA
jgi:hypothetical protein